MPAKSDAQAGFMGMVHAFKSGKLKADDIPSGIRRQVVEASKSISDDDARHFAGTPRAGLPRHAPSGGRGARMRKTYSA